MIWVLVVLCFCTPSAQNWIWSTYQAYIFYISPKEKEHANGPAVIVVYQYFSRCVRSSKIKRSGFPLKIILNVMKQKLWVFFLAEKQQICICAILCANADPWVRVANVIFRTVAGGSDTCSSSCDWGYHWPIASACRVWWHEQLWTRLRLPHRADHRMAGTQTTGRAEEWWHSGYHHQRQQQNAGHGCRTCWNGLLWHCWGNKGFASYTISDVRVCARACYTI